MLIEGAVSPWNWHISTERVVLPLCRTRTNTGNRKNANNTEETNADEGRHACVGWLKWLGSKKALHSSYSGPAAPKHIGGMVVTVVLNRLPRFYGYNGSPAAQEDGLDAVSIGSQTAITPERHPVFPVGSIGTAVSDWLCLRVTNDSAQDGPRSAVWSILTRGRCPWQRS